MMETIYKLTNGSNKTHGGLEWVAGEWNTTSGEGHLCGPGWLHCYSHPILAVMLNPIHAAFTAPKLWVGEARGEKKVDRGLKQGHTEMRVLTEMPLPAITTTQKVAFAILCAMEVYQDHKFRVWAEDWLSGKNRGAAATDAANAASNAAYAAAYAAANAATDAATDAAHYASNAAYAAAYAAANAANAAAYAAANAAHYTAHAAHDAADYAAHAAHDAAHAADAANGIDLIRIAEKAMAQWA